MGVVTFRLREVSKLAEARAWAQYIKVARTALWCGIFAAPFALWALFWTSPNDYPYLSSMLFVPLAVGGCVLLFMPIWRGDGFAKLLLGAGIGFRLAAAGAYIWTGFVIYDAAVDAFHYWSVGLVLVQQFSSIGWEAFQPPYLNTNLITAICGIVMLVTGNALPTLFVLFALAALWGGYFFYRAFCVAFPQGNRGLYGLLVILLPSIVYWSSAIGKDALEQLFLGISAFGFARTIRKPAADSITICLVGVAGAAAVRPHIGAMLAISMLVPFALGKTRGGWMVLSAKLLLVPILAISTYFVIKQAQTFVGVESSDFGSTVAALKQRNSYTAIGGSAFNEGESLTRRVILGPFLPFRPFPWEVHNVMSAFAALEGLALLVWVWRRRREFWQVVRNWREPYVGFILAFALQFSLVFAAAISNFGILARQRIMLLPLVLMLLCAKASTKDVPASGALRRDPRFPSPLPAPYLGRSLS